MSYLKAWFHDLHRLSVHYLPAMVASCGHSTKAVGVGEGQRRYASEMKLVAASLINRGSDDLERDGYL